MKLFKDKQEAIEYGSKQTTWSASASMKWDRTIITDVIEGLKGIENKFFKQGNYGKQAEPRDCRMYLETMREYLKEGIRRTK